jgi:predicted nucleic acid-binding protein
MMVVANASPLIHLSAIQRLEVLRALFVEVFIPCEVYNEVVMRGAGRPGSQEVASANWIHVRPVENEVAVRVLQVSVLGKGEAECIVLAQETNADWIILDDRLARLQAEAMGLKVVGTVGVLLMASEKGFVENFEQTLGDLVASGFRLSPREVERILELWRRERR